jgi:hypothetical protein
LVVRSQERIDRERGRVALEALDKLQGSREFG